MLNQFKKGFFYTTLGQYGNMGITLLINIILSRLLTPTDYGTVAVISVFIVFFQMLSDMGIGPAIIQNKKLTELEISKIFNISAIFSLVLSLLFLGIGFLLSLFYRDEIYQRLSYLLSVAVFFYSIIVVPMANLKKDKNFKIINVSLIASSLAGGVVGVTVALLGGGVYSLVINSVVASVTNFLIILKKSHLKLTKTIEFTPIIKIYSFARNQFAFNFFNYFSRNIDSFLIGKFISPVALGNYNKSYQLLMYPAAVFNGIINPVLQPILSDYEQDVSTIRDVYFNLVHVLLLFAMPVSIFMSMCSKEIIYFLFGKQWFDSVFPLRILSLTIWIQVVNIIASAIYQSRNKTKYLLLNGILSSLIIIISILIGLYFETIQMVSICLSIGFLINFVLSMSLLLYKVLDSKWKNVINFFISPILISFFIFISLYFFQNRFNAIIINDFISLFIQGFIFLVVFICGLFLTREYRYIIKFFKK